LSFNDDSKVVFLSSVFNEEKGSLLTKKHK